MNGKFNNKEKVLEFLKPIDDISGLIADEGIVLNTFKEPKTMGIYAASRPNGFFALINYKPELFDGFDFPSDEKIGILKIPDFVKYFSISQLNDILINFENNNFLIKTEDGEISFKTSDPDIVKESPKQVKFESLVTLDISPKFKNLDKAMTVMHSEDLLVVSGKKDEGVVTFTVRSNLADLKSFKMAIKAEVKDNFENIFNKGIFQLVLKSPGDKTMLSFNAKAAKFDCENKYSMITYLLARKTLI